MGISERMDVNMLSVYRWVIHALFTSVESTFCLTEAAARILHFQAPCINFLTYLLNYSVASLGWVTPGAATEGVIPLFFPEKPGDFFSRQFCGVTHPWFLYLKNWRPFFCSSLLLCHPVSPHTFFYLSDLVSPLFFVNLPTKFFSFGCHPPGGCHPGRFAP